MPSFIITYFSCFDAAMPQGASNNTQFSGRKFWEYFKNWISFFCFFNSYVTHVNASQLHVSRRQATMLWHRTQNNWRDWRLYMNLCVSAVILVVSFRFVWRMVAGDADGVHHVRILPFVWPLHRRHVHARLCENNYKSLFPIFKCKYGGVSTKRSDLNSKLIDV